MKLKLLILGAGDAQVDLIEYCKARGIETYGVSYRGADSGVPLLDHFAKIDVADTDAVREYAVESGVDYIYSVGSDVAVPVFCRISEALGKPCFVSGETAEICCNKYRMREAVGVSEFSVPYMLCRSADEAKKADFYPVVMKPVDSQGQRGVYCVENYGELARRFPDTLKYSGSGAVILEKFIAGREVSVNAYVKNGEIIFSMLSDRESFKDLPTGIIKAHHLPSVYEGTAVHGKINDLVAGTVGKLKIHNGPVYFQIKISGGRPYLIEVTPRLDGCHMWRLIKAYCGVDLLDITMTHLFGEEIKITGFPAKEHMHTEFFCEPPGTVFQAGKYERCFSGYRKLYYDTGDTVKRINGRMEKCGYRIFASPRETGVIGGSGFIGGAFISLYSEKTKMRDVSRKTGIVSEYSAEQLIKALDGCDSVVITAAKKVDPKEPQSLALYETNQRIAENALTACRELGIRNIVFLSSRCVYSNRQPVPVAEDGVIEPINHYGISKAAAELLCEYYNRIYGMNIKTLRLAQVIGKTGNGYMIDTFIRSAMKNDPLQIFGQAEGKRDYIYVTDVCRAIWAALSHYDCGGIYNIGSGRGTSSLELAEAAVKGLGSSSRIEMLTDKPEDASVSYLDVKKAAEQLGFECEYDLVSAFEDLKRQL